MGSTVDSVLCIKGEETDEMITRLFGIHLDPTIVLSQEVHVCSMVFQ